ncbi:hypothetical protein [Nocardia sp. Marseille-Q1738]
MMFVVAGRSGATYSDDFNRANGGLGSNWVTLTAAPVISSNKAQGGTTGPVNASTVYGARWTAALLSDAQESIATAVTPTGTASLGLGAGPFLRCNSSGDRVEALVTNNTCFIFTRISGTPTQRASQAGLTINSGTVVRITAIGNLYSVYLAGSGTPTVTWTDSGGVIAIGSTTRYVGLTVITSEDFAGNPSYSYALDDWSAADI